MAAGWWIGGTLAVAAVLSWWVAGLSHEQAGKRHLRATLEASRAAGRGDRIGDLLADLPQDIDTRRRDILRTLVQSFPCSDVEAADRREAVFGIRRRPLTPDGRKQWLAALERTKAARETLLDALRQQTAPGLLTINALLPERLGRNPQATAADDNLRLSETIHLQQVRMAGIAFAAQSMVMDDPTGREGLDLLYTAMDQPAPLVELVIGSILMEQRDQTHLDWVRRHGPDARSGRWCDERPQVSRYLATSLRFERLVLSAHIAWPILNGTFAFQPFGLGATQFLYDLTQRAMAPLTISPATDAADLHCWLETAEVAIADTQRPLPDLPPGPMARSCLPHIRDAGQNLYGRSVTGARLRLAARIAADRWAGQEPPADATACIARHGTTALTTADGIHLTYTRMADGRIRIGTATSPLPQVVDASSISSTTTPGDTGWEFGPWTTVIGGTPATAGAVGPSRTIGSP